MNEMSTYNISEIVTAALAGSTDQYLQDIVDHGIHNLSNNYHGDSDDEYEEFSEEFEQQATAMLESRLDEDE